MQQRFTSRQAERGSGRPRNTQTGAEMRKGWRTEGTLDLFELRSGCIPLSAAKQLFRVTCAIC
ncbi:MAG: hypothetical protein A2078_08765 [Nitrospirae bacterium GWC2_57_9]|nr:MAG: hypothetical protein A2078_08765 [Nitrospirae bacterium GWC2_57_9]